MIQSPSFSVSFSCHLNLRGWERKKDPSLWFCKIHFFPVELDCGGKTSENITHFTKSVSEGSSLTGKCEAKVCRLTNNICQLRLDFSTFVLAGPSTDTRTTHYTSFGNVVGHSAPSRIAQTSIGKKDFSLDQYQSEVKYSKNSNESCTFAIFGQIVM